MSPFHFSDNRRLARIANELCRPGVRVWGPYPSERLTLSGKEVTSIDQVDWIIPEYALVGGELPAPSGASEQSFAPICPEHMESVTTSAKLDLLARDLRPLAPLLMLTDCGQMAASVDTYFGRTLDSDRLALRFVDHVNRTAHTYVLDFAAAEFRPQPMPASSAVATIPFGLEMFLCDFLAMLDGEIQVWQIVAEAAHSWYLGDKYTNLPSALICAYGEQLRPDLLEKACCKALARIRTTATE